MFIHARDFHENAQRSFEHRTGLDGRNNFPIMPGVVSLAFACELYLKALYVLETGNTRQGHRLNVLYVGLSEPTRTYIKARYEHRRRGLQLVLEEDLLTFANAFTEWRYVYEGEQTPMDITGLAQLTSSLYETCIHLNPRFPVDPYTHDRFTAAMQGVPLFYR